MMFALLIRHCVFYIIVMIIIIILTSADDIAYYEYLYNKALHPHVLPPSFKRTTTHQKSKHTARHIVFCVQQNPFCVALFLIE